MNILDACLDPKVFGPAFRKQESWMAWRAFLAALFGLKMPLEIVFGAVFIFVRLRILIGPQVVQ
jgi:hypothetical protein